MRLLSGKIGWTVALLFTSVLTGRAWSQSSAVADTAWTVDKPLTGKVLPCVGGKINNLFECHNVELLSFLPRSILNNGAGTSGDIEHGFFTPANDTIMVDVWGWTDSTTAREFAAVVGSDGTAFVEVTDPMNPKYLGNLPIQPGHPGTNWRAVTVYKNYAFITSETFTNHGVQIFDLTQLRDVKNAPVVFKETAHYDGIGSPHNIIADEATGYLYAVGGSVDNKGCDGGLHMIDVRDPAKPVFAGCHLINYEDLQCVRYHGPDKNYRDREICIGGNSNDRLNITDVTDKQQPKTVSSTTYSNAAYAGQGWLTEDHHYFFMSDEKDEEAFPEETAKTRTIVFDVTNLAAPVVAAEFFGTTPASDNNLYIRGRYMYQSNHTAGLRVVDVDDPTHPKEVGYFDMVPESNATGHHANGTFTNYPFFKSGAIAVPSSTTGLFLVRFRN